MDLRAMLKALKFGTLVPPQLKDNGAFAGNTYFDTLGLSGLLVLLITGTIDAAIGSTSSSSAPKLEECDTTDGSYTAITDAALAAAIANTEDDKIHGIFVDLTKTHKRYIEINAPTAADGTTGCNFSAIAIGFPSDQMPASASAMGLTELIEA